MLAPGPWDPGTIASDRRGPLGVIVLEGLLIRELSVAGGTAIELFGPSDVVNPWAHEDPVMLPVNPAWSVIEATRIALLEPRTTSQLATWPAVLAAIVRRAGARAERLAVHQAIAHLPRVEQRLLTALWYVAERWGRMTGNGVSVILPLSHSGLGQLVGARRPTVSLALKELDSQGLLHRRDDGSWLLPGRPPERVQTIRRRERVVASRPLGTDPRSQVLAERIVALRGRYERNLKTAAETLAKSHVVREESRRVITEPLRRAGPSPRPSPPPRRG
jgi:DNA-binding transcriptional ArsR family regulator